MLETSALHLDVRTFDDKMHKVMVHKTATDTWKAFSQIDHQYVHGDDARTPRGAVGQWENAYKLRMEPARTS